MGFGRFPPTPGHSFGRRSAGEDEPVDGGRLRPKAAAGLNAQPRREAPAAAMHGEESTPEPRGAASGSWSGDDDDRFAGVAVPSPLAAELAAEARPAPSTNGRDADPALEQRMGDLGADSGADEGDEPLDEVDDIAVTIGRVVGIHGSVLWGTLYDDEDNTAASAARMGALVSLRGPESRVFGVVNARSEEHTSELQSREN